MRSKKASGERAAVMEWSKPVEHLHVALDFGLRHRFFNQQFDWRPFGSAPATAFTMSAAQ